MVSVEDVLNLAEPGFYLVVWLNGDGKVVVESARRDVVLAAFPSVSAKVVDVGARPLEGVEPPREVLEHPRVKRLAEAVGVPPSLRAFEYTFVPLKTVVAERFDSGAELCRVAEEPAAPAIVMRVVHAYYSARIAGRAYDETPGGARACKLVMKGRMWRPEVYIHGYGRRCEVGVKIPADREQAGQLIEYLTRRT